MPHHVFAHGHTHAECMGLEAQEVKVDVEKSASMSTKIDQISRRTKQLAGLVTMINSHVINSHVALAHLPPQVRVCGHMSAVREQDDTLDNCALRYSTTPRPLRSISPL